MSTETKLSALPVARRPSPEALVEKVEFFRLDASRRLSPERQADLGQFMTPAPVAQIMASMFEGYGASLRLLDAGAGVGSLSAALVAELCSRPHPPSDICLSTFEIDSLLVLYLRQTLDACRVHCADSGLHFRGEIRQEDFVAAGTDALRGTLFEPGLEPFDGVILNPPYRKISSDSRMRKQLEALGLETTNLYTAFLAIAIHLLKPGGELVAITPRSFCNGPYFRSFRLQFLDAMTVRRIHCFEARDRAFSEDDVLQENVIVHAVKGKKSTPIVISCGLGPDDDCPTWREVSPDHVVKPNDPDRFIHIPTDALSEAVALRMEQFHCSLHDLGLEVSTGRVVDFRAEPFLRQDPAPGTVPLIYPGHMVGGYVQWPKKWEQEAKRPRAHLRDRAPARTQGFLRGDQTLLFQGGEAAHRRSRLRSIPAS